MATLLAAAAQIAEARADSQEVKAEVALETRSSTSAAQSRHGPKMSACAVPNGSISIDGKGDDASWKHTAFAGGFIQQDPDDGRPATEVTRIKAVYDQDAIYFLVEAHDSQPHEILGLLTRRDALSSGDWVHVWLDTHDDDRTAYRFSVNAAGVKQDARIYDENLEDINWDAIWEAEARTSTSGWSAEMRIPFSQLRYDEGHPRWGFEARRDLRRRNEKSYLAAIPKDSGHLVSHFGILDGLDRLPENQDLSITPYLRGGWGGEGNNKKFQDTGGAEARIGVGSSMILNVSANPDFGQIEADPSVLNLGATEVYFDERRPLFLEGKEIFQYVLGFGDGLGSRETLFYSRRVGRESILGAAKLTGKTADGWSVGILEAVTERGEEPLANATVARISKDLREGKTTIGIIGTNLFRDLDDTSRLEYVRNAASAGFDLQHRVDDYQLVIRGFGTGLMGTKEAIGEVQKSSLHYFQRPDADHVEFDPTREDLYGWGLHATAGKMWGPNWRGAAGLQIFSPEFDPNALGYILLSDRQFAFLWLQARDDVPNETFRLARMNFNLWGWRTFGGQLFDAGTNINVGVTLPNYLELYAGSGPIFSTFDVLALRGGPALRVPSRWEVFGGGKTDDRKSIAFIFDFYGNMRKESAGSYFWMQITMKLRPTSSLELSLQPQYEWVEDDAQYVDTLTEGGVDRWVVGHLTRDTVSLAARADWTINPELSVQLYVAPYLTAGSYTSFRNVINAGSERWTDHFERTQFDGPDKFFFGELRSNFVVRWEYTLGSTLFLVWQHGQTLEAEDRGALSISRDFSNLLETTASDTVLIKLAHWFAL